MSDAALPYRFFKGHFLRMVTSKLAKASGLMLISTVVGGILGYAFQVLMGRMLSVADYGLFVTLMALLTVIAVPLGALNMVVTRKASAYRANGQDGRTAAMYWWVNKRVFWAAAMFVLCALPFAAAIRDYFDLESLVPVLIFLLLILVTPFGPMNTAVLQSQQEFRWLAAYGIAIHAFKILFCVALILVGLELNGALAGMVLASTAIWLMTYAPLRRTVALPANTKGAGGHLSFKAAIPVLIANLAFAIMTQIDMVLVKHYFDAHQAGIYAAASVLGKAVMYLPGAIAIAMFPMVAENQSRAQSSAHLFLSAMAFTAALSGAGALFYFLFSEEIIAMLYGQNYQGADELLRYYGLAMLPMTLVMVAEYFLIAKGRVIFAYLMMVAIPFVLLAAYAFHDDLMDMVYILTACGWGLALIGFAVIGAQVLSARSTDKGSAE